MNYYDGNTVTGLWNYAQQFAMSDNSFGTTFGPSSPGAINLVAGDTGNVGKTINGADTNGDTVADGKGGLSLISRRAALLRRLLDPRRGHHERPERRRPAQRRRLSAGAGSRAASGRRRRSRPRRGGAQPTSTFTPDQFKGKFAVAPASDQGLCNAVHPVGAAIGGTGGHDRRWRRTTATRTTTSRTTSRSSTTRRPRTRTTCRRRRWPSIGTDTQTTTGGVPQFDTANHQYDTSDFDSLVGAIAHGYVSPDHLPAVSFLKAPGYQDGHAGYSDPLDEQQFVANEINALEHTPDWSSTAVVISYDDSDGWYDHVYSGVHNASNTSAVATRPAAGLPDRHGASAATPPTHPPLAGENGRCGYGPRLPLLVISPWAKTNYVDHTLTDQSSILKFVEDNWKLPQIAGSFAAIAGSLEQPVRLQGPQARQQALFLDPTTGQPYTEK